MGKYIVDLSNIPTDSLIEELGKRNVRTDLLYSIEDVKMVLEDVNSDREDEGEPEIVLSEAQMIDILNELGFDNETGTINDQLYDLITRDFEEDSEDF